MVVADIDIAESIELKMMHDIVGHYNRFDIFHLEVDPTPNQPVSIKKVTHAITDRTELLRSELQIAPQVAPDEAGNSANEPPTAVARAKAQ